MFQRWGLLANSSSTLSAFVRILNLAPRLKEMRLIGAAEIVFLTRGMCASSAQAFLSDHDCA